MTEDTTIPDRPSAIWRMTLQALARLPQGALSRGFGRLADTPIPRPLRGAVLGGFARAVGADVDEAELPLENYGSLNEFFVRRLRPGARSWPDQPGVVASPVDGIVGQCGSIEGGRALQAKGRDYSVAELLDDDAAAEPFVAGTFATLYLSPRHYHRIHAPLAGSIDGAIYVPGALLPVNDPAVAHVPDLFARNERLVCLMDTGMGRVAVVAVGAYNVGRISATFDDAWRARPGAPGWATNRRGAPREARRYHPPVEIGQGDEIMAFHLGSTVVLLFEAGRAELDGSLRPGEPVRLGQPIARAAAGPDGG